MSSPSAWFERQMTYWYPNGDSPKITEDHRRCLDVIGSFKALYNLNTPCDTKDAFELFPGGVSVIVREELATFDFDELTTLVIAAHRNFVRVSISPWVMHLDDRRAKAVYATHVEHAEEYGFEPYPKDDYNEYPPGVSAGIMQIMAHPRKPRGSNYERHPSVVDLAARALRDTDCQVWRPSTIEDEVFR